LSPNNWKELRQIGFMVLCELPEESLIGMASEGRLKNYLFRTMWNQANNSRTPFRRNNYNEQVYVQIEELEIEADESEGSYINIPEFNDFIIYCLELIVTNEDPVKLAAEVTYQYYTYEPIRKRSYGEFSTLTGINKATISKYIQLIKTKFKDETDRTGI